MTYMHFGQYQGSGGISPLRNYSSKNKKSITSWIYIHSGICMDSLHILQWGPRPHKVSIDMK